MMLSAAWIMVAALCMSHCNGYAIPGTAGKQDPTSGYVAHHQDPFNSTGKPFNGTGKPADAWGSGPDTVQDPTQKVPDASGGGRSPYSQTGSYGASKAPTDGWNGTVADGDGKGGSDGSADGHVPWPGSTGGQGEPWGPDGSVSSGTSKAPPSPDSDAGGKPGDDDEGLGKPAWGADSGPDGHQPYGFAPYGGADGGPPNGTLSSATSKPKPPSPDDQTSPDPRTDLTDVHHPDIPAPDGHQPWPSPPGWFGNSPGSPNGNDDNGALPPPVGQNLSDCSAASPTQKTPYPHGPNDASYPAWNGTAASPTQQLPGKNPADSSFNSSCDDSSPLPSPQSDAQSPDSKNPDDNHHDDDDDGTFHLPHSPYHHPVLSPSGGKKNNPADPTGY